MKMNLAQARSSSGLAFGPDPEHRLTSDAGEGSGDRPRGEERLWLEVSDGRLRKLVAPLLEQGLGSVEDLGASGDGRASRIETEGGLKIRLELVEDRLAQVPDGLVEQWSGAPPRFSVCLGEQLAATVDVEGAVIDGWVRESMLRVAPATAARLLVEAPLAAVRAGRGWQVVHAATVVGPAGAVVIRGAADSGKSTLAAAAWKAGMLVLGDESILVRQPGLDEVLAAVREVLVAREMADTLDLDGEPVVASSGEEKLRLALEPIPARLRRASHAASVLLGDRDRPGGARLSPLDSGQLMAAFAAGEIPQERWYGSPESVAQAWAARPAFWLDGAADLGGAVEVIRSLCQGEAG